MSLTYSLDELHSAFTTAKVNDPVSKTLFCQRLNLLLLMMRLTKPAERLTNIYFNREFRKYAAPSDFRDPISLRDLTRSHSPRIHRFSPAFVAQKEFGDMYAVQENSPVRFFDILHSSSLVSQTIFADCDDLTDEGTWASVSNISNIATNTVTKHKGAGSIEFDISGAASAEIKFTRSSVVDVSSYTEHQGIGLYMWLPTAPTQVTIKWGNDASNYFSKTVSAQASGEAFDTADKNEIRVLRSEATPTGSPDPETFDYVAITLTFSASITDTDFLIDHIVMFKPEIMPLEYYSSHVSKTTAGVLQAKITESEESTDLPLVYDDYIPTIFDGLAEMHFSNKDVEMARKFGSDFVSKYAPSGALVGGLRRLALTYPDRTQHERQLPILPRL